MSHMYEHRNESDKNIEMRVPKYSPKGSKTRARKYKRVEKIYLPISLCIYDERWILYIGRVQLEKPHLKNLK